MKNIIFVAYEFPPLNTGGSHRPLNFIKNLNYYAINPVVITVADYEYGHIDKSLESEIPSNISIVRTAIHKARILEKFKNTKYFNVTDTVGERWEKALERAVVDALTKYPIDTLIATAPPFSILLICSKICRKYSLKFIPDFRDAWSQWVITPYATYFHYLLTLYYERKILKQAYKIITATPQLKSDFLGVHSDIKNDKIKVILNSISDEIKPFRSPGVKKKKFVVGYVGSFYYNPDSHRLIYSNWWQKKPYQWLQYIPRKENWFYRSPYFFFSIMRVLFEQYPSLQEKFFFHYVGNVADWLIEMVSNFNLEKNVVFLGFKPKDQVRIFIEECDAMLATSIEVERGRDYCIAGKTFDYLAAGKAIIAVVNDGDQRDVLVKSGISIVLDPDQEVESAETFLGLIENRVTLKPNYKYINSLVSKENTRLLANVIN